MEGPVVMLSFSHLWTKILCDFVEPQRPLSPFSLCRVFAEFFHCVFAIQFWHPLLCWQSVFSCFFYFFALTQKVLYDSGWDAQGLPRRWLQADGMKKRNNKRVYVSLKRLPARCQLFIYRQRHWRCGRVVIYSLAAVNKTPVSWEWRKRRHLSSLACCKNPKF